MGNEHENAMGDRLRKACHPIFLGKNRQATDPIFVLNHQYPDERTILESEVNAMNPEGSDVGMAEHEEVAWEYQYGQTVMAHIFTSGRSLPCVEGWMTELRSHLQASWRYSTNVVVRYESLIQSTLIQINETNPEQLKVILQNAWKKASKHCNDHCQANPNFNFQTLCDLQVRADSLAEFHSPDLENFSLDFLKDIRTQRRECFVPIYRSGANFKDMREDVARSLNEMPAREEGAIDYNIDVKEHLEMVRADYTAPHINIEDLLNLPNLLNFIHYRARLDPSSFARQDCDFTYLGRHIKMLSGSFMAQRMISFSSDGRYLRVWRGYGSEPSDSGEQTSKDYKDAYRSGNLFGFMEGFVLTHTQINTYLFLYYLLFEILPDDLIDNHKLKELQDGMSEAEKRGIEETSLRYIESIKPAADREYWPDIAAANQYEPIAPVIKVQRFASPFASKITLAEEHLSMLFDDPDYFTDMVLQQKDHHWCNLKRLGYADRFKEIEYYHEDILRHNLYHDCVRTVLRRAIYEVFLWNTVDNVLAGFNDELMAAYPNSAQIPPSVSGVINWPLPPLSGNAGDQTKRDELRQKYMDLVILVRYYAIYFVNEFRVHAIHAGSEPMRDRFATESSLNVRRMKAGKCTFPKKHFEGQPLRTHATKISVKQSKSDRSEPIRIISELIDNFIACKTTSMHVGIRKVTQRLQMFSRSDKAEERDCFTSLVADTIDSLDLLAELAEHLELHHPIVEFIGNLTDGELKSRFARAAQGNSINLMSFEDHPFEDRIPGKRMKRLCTILDEMQGFNDSNEATMGYARGDLKRLGNAVLKKHILLTNKDQQYKAGNDALKRLQETMGVHTADTIYDWNPKEKPLDIGGLKRKRDDGAETVENVPKRAYREQAAQIRGRAQQRKDESNQEKALGYQDIVLDHQARIELHKKRSAWMEGRRKFRADRNRERWRYTEAGVVLREIKDDDGEAEQPDPNDMGDIYEPMTGPALNVKPPQPLQPAPPQVQQQPAVEPQQAQPKPAPRRLSATLAPDGKPKKRLPKRVWATLDTIFHHNQSSVIWAELTRAMNMMGYQEMGTGSSHESFAWTPNCRWTREVFPHRKGKHIIIARNHEGVRKGAARGKVRSWKTHLAENGLTLSFIRSWYCRPHLA
ncbi:Fc.00g083560.m01.CDS01 [Cosmosporella sp. VM-42]